MCTVTIIPTRGGFRLATNRDESRSRPAALPPSFRDAGGRRLLCPTDPAAGGTWVGVTDAGLALTVLNGNPRPYPDLPPAGDLTSRGLLIPMLAEESSLAAAEGRLRELDLARFAPFRLIGCDGRSVLDAWWDRSGALEASRQPLCPMCWASSGLGDEVVRPRLPLFEEMCEEAGATEAMQDAFHAHAWPEWPQISVMMERDAARTVSTTTVELDRDAGAARLLYRDGETETNIPLPLAMDAACAGGAPRR